MDGRGLGRVDDAFSLVGSCCLDLFQCITKNRNQSGILGRSCRISEERGRPEGRSGCVGVVVGRVDTSSGSVDLQEECHLDAEQTN